MSEPMPKLPGLPEDADRRSAALLIERWASAGVLRCPKCHGTSLSTGASAVTCGACGGSWPVRNRVPDFFNRFDTQGLASQRPLSPDEQAVIDRVLGALDLADKAGMREAVTEIVLRTTQLLCDDRALAAEILDLVDRFSETAEFSLAPPADTANRDGSVRFERHYLAAEYPGSATFSANVRVRNLGRFDWSSRTASARTLMATWLRDGRPAGEPASTRFPVDVPPGGAISLPLRLRAPAAIGAWELRVTLADGGRPVPGCAVLDVPVAITRSGPAAVAGTPVTAGVPGMNYGEDHAFAKDMIVQWAGSLGRQGIRMLEVGSGVHPQTAWIQELEVLAIDISAPLLELGSLYFGERFLPRLGFVCADAMSSPIVPGSLDGAAIFSALHHFPEPEVLLTSLAALVGERGRVFVMCEPVGDSLEGPDTVRDLAKGINEQVFSLDEYQRMFETAGLVPEVLRVDGCSLKAVLRRR